MTKSLGCTSFKGGGVCHDSKAKDKLRTGDQILEINGRTVGEYTCHMTWSHDLMGVVAIALLCREHGFF